MPDVLLKRPDGAVCYWCGVEGWIYKCPTCGFITCDDCRKPHKADSFKFGEKRYWGRWVEPGVEGGEGKAGRRSADREYADA
jgi:hypothetical protein